MSLVLFSGGCDSTLVLHDLLKERNRGCTGSVTALAINHNQVPAISQNKAARLSFIQEMKKRELDSGFHYQEVSIDGNACVGSIGDGGLSQPIIWSMIAMLYVDNNETIYFGYHSGDDFWLHKNAFEDAIMNICKICNKTIKIEYPLRHSYKCDIIRSLKSRGLYDLCWYCEYPTKENKPCGECVPCRTHRTALWQIETFGSRPPRTEDYYPSYNDDVEISDKVINDLSVSVATQAIKDAGIKPCCEDISYGKEIAMAKGT